jgi:DnaK suppressor protein
MKKATVNGKAAISRKMAVNGKGATRGNKREESFRGLLEAKRAELLANLDDVKFDTIAKMGRVAEEDQAQISHEEFISLRMNSMDYEKLKLVDGALERLGAGGYGICLGCDEAISERRLYAVPWAEYCTSCQERVQSGDATPEMELVGVGW